MKSPLSSRCLAALLCLVAIVHAGPIATPDDFATMEDSPLVAPAPGIFANDIADFPEIGLLALVTSPPANGSVSLNDDGSFRYTPNPDFSGTDTFAYRAFDSRTFTIDRTRSVLNIRVQGNVPSLGNASDNKNGRVIGTVRAITAPSASPFQRIHIRDLEARLDEKVTLRLSWLFGAATITAEIDPTRATDPDSLVVSMDQAGPSAAVATDGAFSQLGNTFSALGRARTTAGGLASTVAIPPVIDINAAGIVYDIAPIPAEPTLGAPRIAVSGSNLELTVPLFVTQTVVDPSYTMTITVKGTVVAVAPINPLPESAPVSVNVSVSPVDDKPIATDDRYYTRRNRPATVPATATTAEETIIAGGSVWKWRTGSDLGTAWRNWDHNDATWAAGPGRLGYGEGDEATLVDDNPTPGYSNSPAPTDRYPTTYFRREFTVADPYNATGLSFELIRDDAAVVYLNGVEVHRDSTPWTAGGAAPLPAAPAAITYATLAGIAIPNEQEKTFSQPITISRRHLLEGRNTIAVEVHQAGTGGVVNSSDMSFDLRLQRTTGVAGLLANDRDPEGDPITAEVHTQAANGVAQINPDGSFTYTPAPGFRGTDSFLYRLRQNGVLVTNDVPLIIPGAESAAGSEPRWRYLDSGVDPGPLWRTASFDDATWKEGPAELGYGDGDEKTVVEDNLTPGYNAADADRFITTWFRRRINISNRGLLSALRWRVRRDDGVAVYLNGTLQFTDNLPASFTAATPALGAVANETEFIERRLTNLAAVLDGENIIAVEIHQAAANSSDMSFDLGLVAEYSAGARVTMEVLDDDADNDLISDTWERANGLTVGSPSADDDNDGDGLSNRAEFLAGTDPNNAASALRATAASRLPSGQTQLDFSTVPGIRYQLQRSTSLGTWTNEGPAFTAAGPLTSIPVSGSAGANVFWRLRCLTTWQ